MGTSSFLFQAVVVSMASLSHFAAAFSSGNVGLACGTMYPLHLTLAPQGSEAPYAIVAQKSGKGQVAVTLTGGAEVFRGFILQAKNNENEMVGNFVEIEDSGQILQCGGRNTAVSHNSSKEKHNVTMIWEPAQHRGAVTFKATVVRRYDTFWTGVTSPKYRISQPPLQPQPNALM